MRKLLRFILWGLLIVGSIGFIIGTIFVLELGMLMFVSIIMAVVGGMGELFLWVKDKNEVNFGNSKILKKTNASTRATVENIVDEKYFFRITHGEDYRRVKVTYNFTAQDLERVTKTEGIFVARYAKKPPFTIGMQIPVYYVKNKPKIATIDTARSRLRHILDAGDAFFDSKGKDELDDGFYDELEENLYK